MLPPYQTLPLLDMFHKVVESPVVLRARGAKLGLPRFSTMFDYKRVKETTTGTGSGAVKLPETAGRATAAPLPKHQ